MRILVTGASGFIGRCLCPVLEIRGHEVVKVYRSSGNRGDKPPAQEGIPVSGIDSSTDWSGALFGIDVVVHLAAKVHVMRQGSDSTLSSFRAVNVDGTTALAASAAAAGVKRFIFLSSIKVNGEETLTKPFTADQQPAPSDAYSISKAEAEDRLRSIERETGMELTVIRPPLVYGPGVKGNLRSLSNAVARGWPLPLGSVNNKRDLVSVYNLCDLIAECVDNPAASGRTFLASDNAPMSTPELIRRLAKAQSVRPRLLRMPVGLLRLSGRLLGKSERVDRLVGNLEVDVRRTCELLGWRPPYSVDDSFARMHEEP